MNLSDSKKTLALAGAACGLVGVALALLGNLANMAFCIACFIRDTAGTKEYRSTGGSSPMIRFVLGIVIMVGSLVFLGCPLRMIIRMSAGDLNAWSALIGGLFVVMLIFNVAAGRFVFGFDTLGVIAHSEHLWNILGMYTVGFAAVLAGGCPLRQLILAGQGSSDSAVTVMGMLLGGALCHNLGLAASGTSLNPETKELVAGALPLKGKIACLICIAICNL